MSDLPNTMRPPGRVTLEICPQPNRPVPMPKPQRMPTSSEILAARALEQDNIKRRMVGLPVSPPPAPVVAENKQVKRRPGRPKKIRPPA